MNIRNAIRTLTAAALLALTVVTVSVQHADAKPRRFPTVAEEACAIPGRAVGASEDWVFYRQYDVIRVNGQGYFCDHIGNHFVWIKW